MHMPRISGRIIDLYKLYSEVTERGGFSKVNMRDDWDEVLPALGLSERCLNATAALKNIYRRCLEKYERLNFFGEDPDKIEALEAIDATDSVGRSRSRYSSMAAGMGIISSIHAVPMSYNYRQHVVNMERRRASNMSTDLHKSSPYEKLMLSLLSPLPNEQDFAINCCTLMTNESKHTLKLNEFPKLLDVLIAHAGVFPDSSMKMLFEHVYTEIRRHSLYGFWRDLLFDKPQILELYSEEHSLSEGNINPEHADLLDDVDMTAEDGLRKDCNENSMDIENCLKMDYLNLGRGHGTQDYVGQRVLQVVSILRNLSFFEENIPALSKNRTLLRFIVMSSNIRWGK